MNQPPLFLAIRAVSAEFAKRIYTPVVFIASGSLVVLIILCIWLVTISGWWWFLFTLVIIFTLLFIFSAVLSALIINLLQPQQTSIQKKEVRSFVDSLQATSEAVQTPKFILLFRLIKDVLFPSQKNLINEFTAHTSTLRSGFETIIAAFKN